MCTVIVHVPEDSTAAIRVLAVRDEDPARAWDPLGAWWPELPGVVGVRDTRAGGAGKLGGFEFRVAGKEDGIACLEAGLGDDALLNVRRDELGDGAFAL